MSQQPPQNGVSSSKRFPPAKTTNSTNTTAPSPRTSFETNNNGVPTTTVTAPSTPTHNSIAKKTGTKTSKSIDETMLKHVESSSSVDEGTAPKMTTSSTGIPKGKYGTCGLFSFERFDRFFLQRARAILLKVQRDIVKKIMMVILKSFFTSHFPLSYFPFPVFSAVFFLRFFLIVFL